MSESAANLRCKIDGAADLQSVVRTMKAIAASSIGQYEGAVRSLDAYYRAVQLGLAACFRAPEANQFPFRLARQPAGAIGALVFGSDQGLVGQFNEAMAEFVIETLAALPGKKIVWSVGERIYSRLAETDLAHGKRFGLPNSIDAITPLVGQIILEIEMLREKGELTQVILFHNRPQAGAIYTPTCQRLLPLDAAWRRELETIVWPTKNLPEVMNGGNQTLLAFVREYLFVSLFRTCAESLASENASRLAAMQRAEKNIDELLEDLNRSFHRLRQSSIDEELFDLVSGFEALSVRLHADLTRYE